MMVIGRAEIELFFGGSQTLKDKRRLLKGTIQRIRTKFNVSIAEVGGQDTWQRAVLGIACVSNETPQVQRVISNVINFLETHPHAHIINIKTELL